METAAFKSMRAREEAKSALQTLLTSTVSDDAQRAAIDEAILTYALAEHDVRVAVVLDYGESAYRWAQYYRSGRTKEEAPK